jgi:hypothetical protein
MSEFKVYDNFLDESNYRMIQMRSRDCEWNVQSSNSGDDIKFFISRTDEPFFTDYVFKKILEKIGDFELKEVYFNGQFPGREGEFHTDDCKKTAIYYIGPYQPQWGGFTQLYKSDLQQIIVPPIPNRLLVFNSDILHKGYSYSYQSCPMRINLTYKLS